MGECELQDIGTAYWNSVLEQRTVLCPLIQRTVPRFTLEPNAKIPAILSARAAP
jgi:hypothetical protein